ncbi:peptidyl-prolyl cis-trans isomerase [Halieaceae bacterium IMCC14734]|uniref:Peptidyl-prolyl cis-trans isomerase n=2 Tax=Candidatus Litorirhabdus singularis TaxID=2518993 RepID=A0ABT3THA7_9GAMM|nr:peptidyl-prolyl cis-trans isomerase [Candidatus Litorirhabdus singularis]
MKLLSRPWLHFVLLGFALFYLFRWIDPPPRPSVGPLSEPRIESLQRQWFTTAGRSPSEEQLDFMIAAELDRDMLFQEAIALNLHLYDNVVRQRLIRNIRFLRLGEDKTEQEMYEDALRMELHLGDEVVKRRLIQAMEQLLLAQARLAQPSESDISERFVRDTELLRRPARYTIEHVFFSRDREAELEQQVAAILEQQLSPEQARQLGSPFLPGYLFRAQSAEQLARHFGSAFVLNLQQQELQPQQWVGPVQSTYGQHLVWVEAIEPERDAELEEVRPQISRDLLLEQRQQALRDAVSELRQDYEVIL